MGELESLRVELESLRRMVAELLERSSKERPRLYEMQQAAELLGVSPRTVARMVASGELLPVIIRGKRLIPASEIDRASTPPPPQLKPPPPPTARPAPYSVDAELAKLRARRR